MKNLWIVSFVALALAGCSDSSDENKSEKIADPQSETVVKTEVKNLNIPPQCDDKEVLNQAKLMGLSMDMVVKSQNMDQNTAAELGITSAIAMTAISENTFDEKKIMDIMLSDDKDGGKSAFLYANPHILKNGIKMAKTSSLERIMMVKEEGNTRYCRAAFRMNKNSSPTAFEYLTKYKDSGEIYIDLVNLLPSL